MTKKNLESIVMVYATGAIVLLMLCALCLCCVVATHPIFIIPFLLLLWAFFYAHEHYTIFKDILDNCDNLDDDDEIEVYRFKDGKVQKLKNRNKNK